MHRKILHLIVSTVNVIWQFATFWWSAIILLKLDKIYLVEEMWWSHLDSTPRSFCIFFKKYQFYAKF